MTRVALFFLLVALSHAAVTWHSATPIKHVVVVMFENRAFDHMLGWLTALEGRRDVDGLRGTETNPYVPSDPSKGDVKVSFDQVDVMGFDPGHGLDQTRVQAYGREYANDQGLPRVAPMNGFVWGNNHTEVMQAYNATSVPITAQLADLGMVFDRWHADVPGPTQPNRMFFLSGTSHGLARSPTTAEWIEGYPQQTMFDLFEDAGVPWKIYFSDFPVCLELSRIRLHPTHIHTLDDFLDDAASGDLPALSWVEPRWFDFGEWLENDQHPPNSAALGELFMRQVYKALRASPAWNQTLLVITYDEHGGLYDHVPPPQEEDGVPNPDGINCDAARASVCGLPFNFTRLGVRVPTMMVSPWLPPRSVDHHLHSASSFIATLPRLFPRLNSTPITNRVAWSPPFDSIFGNELVRLQQPRTDHPVDLGVPPHLRHLLHRFEWSQAIREMPSDLYTTPATPATLLPMTDLQKDIVALAASLGVDREDEVAVRTAITSAAERVTVHDGAVFVREKYRAWRAAVTAAASDDV